MIDFIVYLFSNLSGGDIVLLYLLLGLVNYFLVYSLVEDINTANLDDKRKVLLISMIPVINIILFIVGVIFITIHHVEVLLNKMNNTKLF